MKVKSYFDACQLANFIPMKYSETHRNGHLKLKLVPVIHNLIFVYCTKKEIEQIKKESAISSKIRYFIDGETRKPLIVPDKQMEDFIAVSGSVDEQILYLTPQEVALKSGDYVRITG